MIPKRRLAFPRHASFAAMLAATQLNEKDRDGGLERVRRFAFRSRRALPV